MVKITVKHKNITNKLFVKSDYNTEVEAYNELTGQYEWTYIADTVKSRYSGGYLVKNPYVNEGKLNVSVC